MTNFGVIKNVIFDLGNVVIDIDLNITYERFRMLGYEDSSDFLSKYNQTHFFHDLEEGRISANEFVDEVKKRMPSGVSDADIIEAWNALILDYKEDRVKSILKLKESCKVFLLSNTNELHVGKCENKVPIVGSLHTLFDKVYYSHQMNMSKPGEEIFKTLMNDAGIDAKETLFLDDSPANIKTAHKLGMKTWLVENPNEWAHKINLML